MRLGAIARRVWWDVRGEHPPRTPHGWVTGAPDFVGVGVQRCGTTWWYELVAAHPAVQAAPRKELHYLHRFWRRPFTNDAVSGYARFFPRPPGLLTGEWSPGYLAHFWIPPLLRRAAPGARLLVLLRDPVARFVSGLALQSETRRASAAGASTAFRLGCYASQLAHLYRHFPPEQVLVLQFERCVADPKPELARTYAFLGLADDVVPPDLTEVRNARRGRRPVLPAETIASLVEAYEPEVRRLADVAPTIDVSLWPNFAHLA